MKGPITTPNEGEINTGMEICKNKGKAFSIIRGQCQKFLIEKMKSYPEWEILEQYGDPLLIIKVIEKHLLSHTEDMCPFASVYEQERTMYTFHHNYLTNDQWYKKFNTRSDSANDTGVTRQHKVLLDNVDQEKHSDYFENITGEE